MFRIGIISDTHNFLDPKVPGLFAGVDHILHAGDIGSTAIIQQLKTIAPVTAVLGNTDDPGLQFKLTELVQLAGRKFWVQHIVDPAALERALQIRVTQDQIAVVVFGHTHKPFSQTIGSTLFFNPGSAGKARFGLPRTLAILHCLPKELRPEYLKLD